jgi:predicted DNA-binding protein
MCVSALDKKPSDRKYLLSIPDGVYTGIDAMAQRTAKAKRKGKALLVYFRKEDAERLSSVAKERRVAKAELVRVAVGRFLNDLNSGQLELPLGL